MILPDGYSDVPNGKIAAVVTHLEMTAPPARRDDPPGTWSSRKIDAPALDWYRDLHRRVGEEWLWFSRMRMNDAELAANELADDRVVHDLNENPRLPLPDAAFDAVTCCVSVDYLVRPVDVFREVARVLRPGGLVVVTFSNRCFPTKAIRGWLETDDEGRVEIVRRYLDDAGGFGPASAELRARGDAFSDPVYAVWARRVLPV